VLLRAVHTAGPQLLRAGCNRNLGEAALYRGGVPPKFVIAARGVRVGMRRVMARSLRVGEGLMSKQLIASADGAAAEASVNCTAAGPRSGRKIEAKAVPVGMLPGCRATDVEIGSAREIGVSRNDRQSLGLWIAEGILHDRSIRRAQSALAEGFGASQRNRRENTVSNTNEVSR